MAGDKTNVVVLGATGMLGSMLLDYLAADDSLSLVAMVRNRQAAEKLGGCPRDIEVKILDAEQCGVDQINDILRDADWAINAIGIIKPYIHDDNAAEVERAVKVNSMFPRILAQGAEKRGCRVLQIATDCVYSGTKGCYIESDKHDAWDVYGKTKSIGEVYSPNVIHLRCSIIGPELKAHISLLDWFLGQPNGAKVSGFTNHKWNGIPTLHFSKLCRGIIGSECNLEHIQHVIPKQYITKAEMLKVFAREFGRDDIDINSTEAKTAVDRTLATENKLLNQRLWQNAGYSEPPSIPQMIAELARFERRVKGVKF